MHAESEQFVIKIAKKDNRLNIIKKSTVNFKNIRTKDGTIDTLYNPDGAILIFEDPKYGFTFRYAYGAWLHFKTASILRPEYPHVGKLTSLDFFPTPEWKPRDEILKDVDVIIKFFDDHHWKRDEIFLESYRLKENEVRDLPKNSPNSEAIIGWRAEGYRIGLIVTNRKNELTRNQEEFRLSVLIEDMELD